MVELTDENFDELSGAQDGGKGTWFVKFYAPWYVTASVVMYE